MRIAVLGWGSLIWSTRNLDIVREWHRDGPILPIEFARISEDGRLTLVLTQGVANLPVLWAMSSFGELGPAIENLRIRETLPTKAARKIGFASAITGEGRCALGSDILERIVQWIANNNLEAAIWTDLKANFLDCQQVDLTVENVIRYLGRLDTERRSNAKEYIQKTPKQIETVIRAGLRERLGWNNLSEL